MEFKLLLHDVLTILLGISPDNLKGRTNPGKKSIYYKLRTLGVLGMLLAIYATIEDHKKGTLHIHLIGWGGIDPHILQELANIQDICNTLSEVLDELYSSQLPHDLIITNCITSVFKNHGCKFVDNDKNILSLRIFLHMKGVFLTNMM